MRAQKLSRASLLRPKLFLPKVPSKVLQNTLAERQAFHALQDEIWRTLVKKLEKPVRKIHSNQHRIIEVLGAIRYYINHKTGEIHLRVRYRGGSTVAAFAHSHLNYHLDLPLFDINFVIEAFLTSWNQKIYSECKSFEKSYLNHREWSNALFNNEDSFHKQLIKSIAKAVKRSVNWKNLRHQVRDALGIDVEVLDIFRRARLVRHQRSIDNTHYDTVIEFLDGYRQLNKEAPNLLWLYTLVINEKKLPQGEITHALKKLILKAGCGERGWRLICKSTIRDFESALKHDGSKWNFLIEYIKLHNLLDRNQMIPKKLSHLFSEPNWHFDRCNRIFYRGIQLKPALLNHYINALACSNDAENFLKGEATAVFSWLSEAKVTLDKNQVKLGWSWLLKQAHQWLEDQVIRNELTKKRWHCGLGEVTISHYRFVPLTTAWEVRQEAFHNRHCADQFIDACLDGIYQLFSVYSEGGKHKATLGVELKDNIWKFQQLEGFANQPTSYHLYEVATSIIDQLNYLDEGKAEEGQLTLKDTSVETNDTTLASNVCEFEVNDSGTVSIIETKTVGEYYGRSVEDLQDVDDLYYFAKSTQFLEEHLTEVFELNFDGHDDGYINDWPTWLSELPENASGPIYEAVESYLAAQLDMKHEDFCKDSKTQELAYKMFQNLDSDLLDKFGIVLIEGKCFAGTYYMAELRIPIEEANEIAKRLNVAYWFKAE